MMEIKLEIKATPFAAYLVTRNSDGQDAACTLTRGVWNVVDTGKFFAYEQDAYVEGEAFMCSNCSEWTIYPFNGLCPTCKDKESMTMNLLKDALYYLHPDCATNEKNIAVGRGQLSGVITTIMALRGCLFEDAVKVIVPYLPEKIVWACIPEPWQGEFLRQGAVCNVSTQSPRVGEVKTRVVARYVRMLGLL